ncbi:MAG: TlpA family protein disulfide reductase, partial [Geodermatophilaceae bacterium]
VADRSSAPQFGGSLLDGSAFDSAGLVGKVAVINFWGQWCAPCRVETPEFQRVYADVRDRGVSFLGINVKDNDQLASAYLRNAGIEYPSVFDPRGEVALAFRNFPPAAIPSTVLLDRRGRVAAVYLGTVSESTLRSALDLLLGEG